MEVSITKSKDAILYVDHRHDQYMIIDDGYELIFYKKEVRSYVFWDYIYKGKLLKKDIKDKSLKEWHDIFLQHTKKYTAKDFGYKGGEMLMDPRSGNIDTSNVWADEVRDWCYGKSSFEDFEKQFSTLIEVEEKNGKWVEKK